MPQLTRTRRRRGDRGAVATLVAVLLAGNVLLGMGALTIDVGLLYAEREDLQSGADAGALAVAKMCAASHRTCDTVRATTRAVSYADQNADDGESQAAVCGRVLSGGSTPVNRLSPCAPGPSNLTSCVGSAPLDPAPYVEVRTRTLQDNGSTLLPYAFAGSLTGTDGATLGACSRVSWGPVRRASSSVAMAISMCDFRRATNQGVEFQPPPDGGRDDPEVDVSGEVAVRWRPATNSGCTFGGNSFPSGFNWLPSGGSCSRTITAGNGNWITAPTNPGSPANCASLFHNAHHSLTPISVAVIDDSRSTGPGTWELRVAGIAVFVITGWRRPTIGPWTGGPDHDHLPTLHGTDFCPSPNAFCAYGYFTTRVMRIGSTTPLGPLGARHFGAIYVRTVG